MAKSENYIYVGELASSQYLSIILLKITIMLLPNFLSMHPKSSFFKWLSSKRQTMPSQIHRPNELSHYKCLCSPNSGYILCQRLRPYLKSRQFPGVWSQVNKAVHGMIWVYNWISLRQPKSTDTILEQEALRRSFCKFSSGCFGSKYLHHLIMTPILKN